MLVPTYDGGYSLIGQRCGVDILGETLMSTTTVLDDLLYGAAQRGVTVSTMPPTWDVDEESDLRHLTRFLAGVHDMPATTAAVARLGLVPEMVASSGAMRLAGGAA